MRAVSAPRRELCLRRPSPASGRGPISFLIWLSQRLLLRSLACRPGAISLAHVAARYFARNVRRIAIVRHLASLLMTAFCANEYMKFRIEERIAQLYQFQQKLAAALLAMRGWRGRDKVTHSLFPFVRHASQRTRDAQKDPDQHDLD